MSAEAKHTGGLSIEVRNRIGVVVSTFSDVELALRFVRDRQDLGRLRVFAVETIRRERELAAEPEISTARRQRRRAV